jgi:hypothetical protein
LVGRTGGEVPGVELDLPMDDAEGLLVVRPVNALASPMVRVVSAAVVMLPVYEL